MSTCGPCSHRNRDEIDAQLVAGVSYRSISKTFQVSIGAISRHKEHVKEMIKTRTQGEREEHGSLLVDRVTKLAGEAEELVAIAKAEKNYRGATSALVAACKLLDLVGRLSGELQQANAAGGGLHLHLSKTTVNNAPSFDNDLEFAEMIAEATQQFDPEVIERMKALVCNARATPLLMR